MSRRLVILLAMLGLCMLVNAQTFPYNPSFNYGRYPQLPYWMQPGNRPESDDENFLFSKNRNPEGRRPHTQEEYFFNPYADAPWYVQAYVNMPRASAKLFKIQLEYDNTDKTDYLCKNRSYIVPF